MEPRQNFLSIPMQQNRYVVPLFDLFFSEIGKVNQILELGTGGGGLSIFLQIYCLSTKTEFVTVDNRETGTNYEILKLLKTKQKHFLIFDQKSIEFISDFIQQEGRTVLLCDNGNKIKEFKTFVPKLKKGDFILIHDYCDMNGFSKKYWPYCEVQLEDIKETVKEFDLELFMYDDFLKGGWICFFKR